MSVKFAEVTLLDPLQVRLSGDKDNTNVQRSLAKRLAVGDAVLAENVNRRLTIIGRVGGMDLTRDKISSDELADGSVLEAKLAAAAVTRTKIVDDAIDQSKVAQGNVVKALMAVDSIQETHIANDAVTSPKILAGSIQTAHMVAGSIEGDRIASYSLDATRIASYDLTATNASFENGIIQSAHIGSLSASKITAGTIDSQEINLSGTGRLTAGTVLLGQVAASEEWQGLRITTGPTTFSNAFVVSPTGTVLFRLNRGGTHSIDYNSDNGTLYIKGTVDASNITSSTIESSSFKTSGTDRYVEIGTSRLLQGSIYLANFSGKTELGTIDTGARLLVYDTNGSNGVFDVTVSSFDIAGRLSTTKDIEVGGNLLARANSYIDGLTHFRSVGTDYYTRQQVYQHEGTTKGYIELLSSDRNPFFSSNRVAIKLMNTTDDSVQARNYADNAYRDITASGYRTGSSRAYKNSIEDYEGLGMSVVKKIRARSFKMNHGEAPEGEEPITSSETHARKRLGFVVEELPDEVRVGDDSYELNAVVALNTKAIQELDERIAQLEAQGA